MQGRPPLADSLHPGLIVPDKSLPIVDLTYRLVLELNRAVGVLSHNQRQGLGRRIGAAGFDLLEALVAVWVDRNALRGII